MNAERIGGWIQTYTVGQFWPLDPRPEEIHILDIAHSLSMQCRFNGHTLGFYSVAEHCCHVHDLLPAPLKRAGLLHDASEAYLCDLPRPLKKSPGFGTLYQEAEERLEIVIAARFGFEFPYASAVHDADARLLATEAAQLMTPLHPEWPDYGAPVEGLVLPCWTPARARTEFLARFTRLKSLREWERAKAAMASGVPPAGT